MGLTLSGPADPPAPDGGPPTFAGSVAARDRDSLVRLLALRPDLCAPVPHDLAELAARAAAEASVRRALDGLDRRHLAVAEALAALGDPAGADEVAALVELSGADTRAALARLRELALLWGDDDALHVLRAVRSAFGPWPGGLAHPSPVPGPPAAVEAAVARLDTPQRRVLERLAWGPPTGAVRNAERPLPPPGERSPVEALLADGLLRVAGPDTVVLPREVALRVRGGFLREPLRTPPPLPRSERPARLVEHAGAGAAYELVHDVEVVVDDLGARRPALLRTGGVGTRELGLLARRHGLDAERTAYVVELAYAADLVATTGGRLSATTVYEGWLELATAERWTALARGWRDGRRWAPAALDGHALGDEGDVRWAVDARATALAALDPGVTPEPDAWAARVAYARPGLARHVAAAEVVAAVGDELGRLGVVALGAVNGLLAALRDEPLPDGLAALFPAPVDHFVVQADLTAVAAGPLHSRVARVLRLVADQESRGGAGVFRFSAASVRRAFDAGWDAETIGRWLADRSSTGVPQPLAYLIGDVARVHGAIRVGRAAAYVRIEDPAQVSSVLAHPGAGALGLRQVGPGALVADADPDEVVNLLRSLGLAPAAEDSGGGVLHAPAPPRTPARTAAHPDPVDPGRVADLLVERAEAAVRRSRQTTSALDRLRVAQAAERAVDVAFVADDGRRERATLVPVQVAAGMVRLAGAGRSLTLPLARVVDVEDPAAR